MGTFRAILRDPAVPVISPGRDISPCRKVFQFAFTEEKEARRDNDYLHLLGFTDYHNKSPTKDRSLSNAH